MGVSRLISDIRRIQLIRLASWRELSVKGRPSRLSAHFRRAADMFFCNMGIPFSVLRAGRILARRAARYRPDAHGPSPPISGAPYRCK